MAIQHHVLLELLKKRQVNKFVCKLQHILFFKVNRVI